MFKSDGLHSGARPQMSHWGGAPYGTAHTPNVEAGGLQKRNKKFYNIGQPGGGLDATRVPLACHHVVGWDIIWGFWNAMIKNENFNAARTYLSFFGAPKPQTANMAQLVKTNKFVADPMWSVRMCWKPNNIVRGPEHRADDPNDKKVLLEKIDFQTARADIYGTRVSGLVEAGRNMCHYINYGTARYAEDAIEYFRSIQRLDIMEWNEDFWAVDSASPAYSNVKSNTGGYDVTHPKWRIFVSTKKSDD